MGVKREKFCCPLILDDFGNLYISLEQRFPGQDGRQGTCKFAAVVVGRTAAMKVTQIKVVVMAAVVMIGMVMVAMTAIV